MVTSELRLINIDVESLVNHGVFVTRKVEVRILEGEFLTSVVGIRVNTERVALGDVDTLDRESPAQILEVGDVTAEGEEFTLLVDITVDNGATHVDRDLEFSETEGFITSTLIEVNVDLDLSRAVEVRNNDGPLVLWVIRPASTTDISITFEEISLRFVSNFTIDEDNKGIVGIDGVNKEGVHVNNQERVRGEVTKVSDREGTGTSSSVTTEDLNGIGASGNTVAVIGCPLAGIEVRAIEKFLDNNLRLIKTIVGQNVEISETPRSSVGIVGGNVSFEGNSELGTRDGDIKGKMGLSIRLRATADVGVLGVELSGEVRTKGVNLSVVDQNLEQSVLVSTTFPTGEPLIEQNQVEHDLDILKGNIRGEGLRDRTSSDDTGTTNISNSITIADQIGGEPLSLPTLAGNSGSIEVVSNEFTGDLPVVSRGKT